MRLKRKLFDLTTNICIKILNLNKANKITTAIVEKINPHLKVSKNGVDYFIDCPNELIRWRAKTFFTKEPDTIEWIDSFNKNDILFDIGANIGLYTIYAAKKGNKVIAFEPESQNYAAIHTNLYLNKVYENSACINIALSNKNSLDKLYIPNFGKGEALCNLGEAKDWNYKTFQYVFVQSVLSYTLDSFLESFPDHFPNHIKIDVDGLEAKIIDGARKTLNDTRLKSILIELNESVDEDLEIIEKLQSHGLKFYSKYHHPMFEGTKYESIYNYIFIRK